MSDTQVLLGKIAALREQLTHSQGQANTVSAAVSTLVERALHDRGLTELRRKLDVAAKHEAIVQDLLGIGGEEGEAFAVPSYLAARARRALHYARELVGLLKTFGEDKLLQHEDGDPLPAYYQNTVLQTEVVFRCLRIMPESPSAQQRLCGGLERVLEHVAQRTDTLALTLKQRRCEKNRLDFLTELLTRAATRRLHELQPFFALAEQIFKEAQQGWPLRFTAVLPDDGPRLVAVNSLTVAQVVARVIRNDPDWRDNPTHPIVAALLHDVGMLALPSDILFARGPLAESQRAVVESHPRVGFDLLQIFASQYPWLLDAVQGHHEKLDGTGYPAGLSDMQIPPMARLLAVGVVYAAMCGRRPHREAIDTRTALTDTLMMSQLGAIDRSLAKGLLELTFYPIGTGVELTDGTAGVVTVTQANRRDMNVCGRPVVLLLTDPHGQPLPYPQSLNIAECEGRGVVRSLPLQERRRLFGSRYPQWI